MTKQLSGRDDTAQVAVQPATEAEKYCLSIYWRAATAMMGTMPYDEAEKGTAAARQA
jgi:hypothetical protein